MIYRPLGNTGLNVSAVVYGGIVSMANGQDFSDEYVNWAIEQGVNYFDVAPTYGDSQEKLGNSLIPYRKNVYLACKTMCREAEDAKREMDESFRLLHTDYFDNYQMHAIKTMEDVDRAFAKGGTMEFLIKAKEEGIIKNISITGHGEAAMMECIRRFDGYGSVLFPFNWGMNLNSGYGSELMKLAKEKGLGVLAMKSFIERAWIDRNERLSSGYFKSWCKPIANDEEFMLAAMKYALKMGADTLVPPGNFHHFSFAVNHIEEVLANPLTEKDLEILKKHLPDAAANPVFFRGGELSNSH